MSAPEDLAQRAAVPGDSAIASDAVEHPGVVTFVDADTFAEYQIPLESLPWEVAWADTEAGLAPVTRIVGRRRDGALDVESYGADGRLLHVVSRPTAD
jgi:hypothetical protein